MRNPETNPASNERWGRKESQEYLERINGHPHEKIYHLIKSLEEGALPIISPEVSGMSSGINILEIGPGGGEPVRYLEQYISENKDNIANNNPRVFALDCFVKPLVRIRDTVNPIQAKIESLPLRNESFSAVNVSAVLHEVSSYGIRTDGLANVNLALREICRVIHPNGVMCYRDVYAPECNLKKFIEQDYTSSSWVFFIKHFVPVLLSNKRKIYKGVEEEIKLRQNNDEVGWRRINEEQPLSIYFPIGLHKEIQRHYLVFRDYLLRNNRIGVKIIHEEEESDRRSLVVFISSQHPIGSKILETLASNDSYDYTEIGDNVYHFLNRTDFERLIDEAICILFKKIEKGNKNLKPILDGFLESEGKEYYIYYDVSDMILNTGKISLEQSNGRYIMLPKNLEEDLVFFPRDYYQKYLNNVLKEPLKEGKQLIRFWKIPREKARDIIKTLKSQTSSLKDFNGGRILYALESLEKSIQDYEK